MTKATQAQFVRGLGLWDATAIVAGSMLGSGVFIVAADIARQVEAPAWLLLVWLVTGGLTIVGALTYGELAGMMPHAGGQYVYLRQAYGPLVGFLYGWTLFTVIQTGTIAAVAVAFAKFSAVLFPVIDQPLFFLGLSFSAQKVLAITVIALLTYANCTGLQTGRWVQNAFTATKVGALLALVLVGLLAGRNEFAWSANAQSFWGPPVWSLALLPALGAAMVGSLFSADAWNNITFAAAEVRDPARTVPLSLLLGTSIIITLYLGANIAYLVALPLQGDPAATTALGRGIAHAHADRVATAVMEVIFGSRGAIAMAIAIMVSTFGCVNGLILAGARVYFAMAQHGLFFQAAGRLNRQSVPAVALVMQGVWAALLTLSGSYGDLLDYVVFAALLFYALTAAAVFVLRRTAPELPRPYRAFGYPVLPALYIAVTACILLDLLVVKPNYTWPGLLIVLSGVPVFHLWAQRRE